MISTAVVFLFDVDNTLVDNHRVFRPIYDSTQGADGFVSLEVSPSRVRVPESMFQRSRGELQRDGAEAFPNAGWRRFGQVFFGLGMAVLDRRPGLCTCSKSILEPSFTTEPGLSG